MLEKSSEQATEAQRIEQYVHPGVRKVSTEDKEEYVEQRQERPGLLDSL